MLTNKNIIVVGEYYSFTEFYDDFNHHAPLELCKRIDDWLASELDPNDEWTEMDWCETALQYVDELLNIIDVAKYYAVKSHQLSWGNEYNSIIILQFLGEKENE